MQFGRAAKIVLLIGVALYWFRSYMKGCAFKDESSNGEGKTMLITGGNNGLGFETAKEFYRRGFTTIMACRNMKKCENAKKSIQKAIPSIKNKEQIKCLLLDLSSLKSVKEFPKQLGKIGITRIDIAIFNAGLTSNSYTLTENNFEVTIGVNHFGHFELFSRIKPMLLNSAKHQLSASGKKQFTTSNSVRVVVLSSLWSYWGRDDMDSFFKPNAENFTMLAAYQQSKLANVMFAKELTNRYAHQGIIGFSLHPGAIATDIVLNSFPAIGKIAVKIMSNLMKDAFDGIQTCLTCALGSQIVPGAYYTECEPVQFPTPAKDATLVKKVWDETERVLAEKMRNL